MSPDNLEREEWRRVHAGFARVLPGKVDQLRHPRTVAPSRSAPNDWARHSDDHAIATRVRSLPWRHDEWKATRQSRGHHRRKQRHRLGQRRAFHCRRSECSHVRAPRLRPCRGDTIGQARGRNSLVQRHAAWLLVHAGCSRRRTRALGRGIDANGPRRSRAGGARGARCSGRRGAADSPR